MLIIVILSLVCPTGLLKYDLRKQVNTFKARSLSFVKLIQHMECATVENAMSYSDCN